MSAQLENVLQLLGPSTGGIRGHVATLAAGSRGSQREGADTRPCRRDGRVER